MFRIQPPEMVMGSHPSRGAWIEIAVALVMVSICAVAPLTGCVD